MREAFIPYCRPDVGEDEARACAEAIRAGWLTTGPKCETFERNFESASGVAHAVALNSCTAGLHLALVALGIGPGDEVVMPSLTFVAGAQCTLELGARPVFCDVEPDTFAASIRTIAPVISPRTKAIIAMPYAGRPLDNGRAVAISRTSLESPSSRTRLTHPVCSTAGLGRERFPMPRSIASTRRKTSQPAKAVCSSRTMRTWRTASGGYRCTG